MYGSKCVAYKLQQHTDVHALPAAVGDCDNGRFYARIPFRVSVAVLVVAALRSRFIQI